LKIVPEIEEKLKEYELYMDRHRILVFYYKIASSISEAATTKKQLNT
jgi:hypothetical protein